MIHPTPATWTRIDEWVVQGAASGHRFGLGDLLVAALAADAGSPIRSLDGDFRRMQRRGMITLFEP